jgi:site-specific recombinase XerD
MMERSTTQRIGDVEQMVTSFTRHLRAENKAAQTITAYTYAPLQLAAFLRDRGMPADVASIHREHVEAYLEDLLTRRGAATANNRYRGLVAFFAWLQEEVEIPASPMACMKPPAIPQQYPSPRPLTSRRSSRAPQATTSRIDGTPRSSDCSPTRASALRSSPACS